MTTVITISQPTVEVSIVEQSVEVDVVQTTTEVTIQDGVRTFANLSDTLFTNLQEGDVPVYDIDTGKWLNEPQSGGVTDVSELTATGAGDGSYYAVLDEALVERTASEVQSDLGLVVGTDVQAYSDNLADIAGLTPGAGEDGYSIVWDDGAGAFVLVEVTGGGGDTLPIVDTTAVVKGSADPTKLLRFEVDGFTAGTTRVLTPPNADGTIAVLGLAQTWSATQTINVTGPALELGDDAPRLRFRDNGGTNNRKIVDFVKDDDLFYIRAVLDNGTQVNAQITMNVNLDTVFPANLTVTGSLILSSNLSIGVNKVQRDVNNWLDWGNGFRVQAGGADPLNFLAGGDEVLQLDKNATTHTARLTRIHTTTNAIDPLLVLRHNTSGTPAAGYGGDIRLQLETSTTENQEAVRIAAVWNEATHASRKADLILSAYDTAEREGVRIRANGSAAAIGFLGATPVARAAHIADAAGDDAATVNAILVVLENLGFIATS